VLEAGQNAAGSLVPFFFDSFRAVNPELARRVARWIEGDPTRTTARR